METREDRKRCRDCGDVELLTEFNHNKAKRDGRQDRCRRCDQIRARAYYAANRAAMAASVAVSNKRRRDDLRRRLYKYLLDHSCVDCGESRIPCLDFDHRDGATKFAGVSKLAQHGWSWVKILEEIAKCDVRCANCHRIRTAEAQEWYVRLLASGL